VDETADQATRKSGGEEEPANPLGGSETPSEDHTTPPPHTDPTAGGMTQNRLPDLPEGPPKNELGRERKPKPRAATTSSASGNLSAEQVDQVVSQSGDLFARCSPIEAVINVHATVDTDGRVLAASASRSAPDDARMRDCVTAAFRSLSFPKIEAAWPTQFAFDLRVTPH
jgi:hypothetical protein